MSDQAEKRFEKLENGVHVLTTDVAVFENRLNNLEEDVREQNAAMQKLSDAHMNMTLAQKETLFHLEQVKEKQDKISSDHSKNRSDKIKAIAAIIVAVISLIGTIIAVLV